MSNARSKYQYGFSDFHRNSMYDILTREQKAKKIISVLNDFYSGGLEGFSLLDLGCSTGIIANILSKKFGRVVGIDIDTSAIKYANENFRSENLEFTIGDAMCTGFTDESFDVIVCAHVYEHVPDASLLLSEINRILKPGGVCYFAAANRLNPIEPHYKLAFLSIIPKPFAHLYLRIMGKGNYYYESLLTFWGLKKLVSGFNVMDYTLKILKMPQKYSATEMIQPGTFKQKMILRIIKIAYWLSPTYIWLLQKKKSG